MAKHMCRVWWKKGLDCPFARLHEDDDEDDPDSDDIPIAIPARKQREGRLDNLSQLNAIFQNIGEPEHLQRGLREAAFTQERGGAPFLPKIGKILDELPVERLRFTGRGHEGIMAALAAIVIFQLSKQLASSGFLRTSLMGSRLNARAATQFSQLTQPTGRGSARTQGRGGFHVNAADQLRRMLGGKRKLRGGRSDKGAGSGSDTFSETGFN